jgi:uncharacterized protein (TIGR02466 family)
LQAKSNDMTAQIIPIFPSLILINEVKNFNKIKEELIDWIKKYQKSQNNYQVSGRNTWQSPTDFYKKEKSFFKYKNLIENIILETIISSFTDEKCQITNMWINVNGPGGYNIAHTHPSSDLSGVLWINCPKNCGVLRFESPNHFTQYKNIQTSYENIKQSLNYYCDFWLEPSEGKLCIFPSDINHFVEENLSEENRISISFNIKIDI